MRPMTRQCECFLTTIISHCCYILASAGVYVCEPRCSVGGINSLKWQCCLATAADGAGALNLRSALTSYTRTAVRLPAADAGTLAVRYSSYEFRRCRPDAIIPLP